MQDPISVWSLVLEATIVVQIVMAMLVLMSLTSWVMIFLRGFHLSRVRAEIAEFEEEFWSGRDLRELYREISAAEEEGELNGIEGVFVAGFREFSRLAGRAVRDPEAVMQGAQRAMRVAVQREEERLERYLPFLATVGSTAPYIGLFGTVWGIMNSFRSLASEGQATLATVAPGISEALVATAIGLFAAIPAVIAYNRFAARVEVLMNRYVNFAEELSSILHRTVHSSGERS